IRNEFKTSGFVKALCSFYQTEIALIDKIGKAEALVLILFGHRNHEPQVSATQFIQCRLIALANSLCQFHFFLGCNQIYLADILKITIKGFSLTVGYLLSDFKLSHIKKGFNFKNRA